MNAAIDYEKLTFEALKSPGQLHAAYSAFHQYSIANQLFAASQLSQIEPINSYGGWKEIGRQVQKGAKGIALMMPIFRKAKEEVTEQDRGPPAFYQMRRYWFPLSATEGQEYTPPPVPGFDKDKMLSELHITEEPFQSLSGNCMGYAKTDARIIAVSPLAFDSFKTLFHECAHVLLHPGILSADDERPARDVREVEAELSAYLVKSVLGSTDGLEFSRGYIRNWIDDGTVEKVRFPKVYSAADAILKAGRIMPTPA